LIATRALQLERWTREFLDAHRTAVVLNLGCGLDSRAERIAPPSSAVWVDLDRPEVIALRQRLYPEQDRTRPIASSVTDSAWWNEVSSDRPVLLLAEGLFMYLTSDDVAGVLRAATERIARGRVAFDAVAPWAVRASALQPAMRQAGTRFRSGLPSGSILEREHPRL
jgi:O-methyltransferase involved in polyketide biosynthesis